MKVKFLKFTSTKKKCYNTLNIFGDISMNSYQEMSLKTANYPNIGKNIFYPALGLAGETGEVVELVKRIMRDHAGVITDEVREKLIKELGDVLWYTQQVASELGSALGEVAITNLAKLQSRKERGKIQGSGDDR